MSDSESLREEMSKAFDDPERPCRHLAPKALMCADCAVSVALRLVQEEIDKMTKIRWPEGVKPAPETLRPRVEGMEAVAGELARQLEDALQRAEAAEATVELLEGEVKAAETRSGMDNVVAQFEAQLKVEREAREAAEKRADGNFESYERVKAMLSEVSNALAEYREKYQQAKRHVHRWWGTGDNCQCCGEPYPEHMRAPEVKR